jgi:hypothetical protein
LFGNKEDLDSSKDVHVGQLHTEILRKFKVKKGHKCENI